MEWVNAVKPIENVSAFVKCAYIFYFVLHLWLLLFFISLHISCLANFKSIHTHFAHFFLLICTTSRGTYLHDDEHTTFIFHAWTVKWTEKEKKKYKKKLIPQAARTLLRHGTYRLLLYNFCSLNTTTATITIMIYHYIYIHFYYCNFAPNKNAICWLWISPCICGVGGRRCHQKIDTTFS